MDYVVLDHHYDPGEEVYRLTIGTPVHDAVPMTDDDGSTLQDDQEQVIYEQRVVGHEALEDFVFAADDERWQGLGPDEIAKVQRDLIKAALEERDRARAEMAERQAGLKSMPGSGEAL